MSAIINIVLLCFFVLVFLPSDGNSEPKIFAAKKLGIEGNIPTKNDLIRPFESPFLVTLDQAGKRHKLRLTSCQDYLRRNVRKHILDTDNPADYPVLKYQAVPCKAMALLKSAKIPKRTALPPNFSAELQTSNYSATLWPAISNDEVEELSRPGLTLEKATGQPSFRGRDPDILEMEAEDMFLRMTLLGRGDFDHDGWEDAVFLWQSHVLKGTYSNADAVVLTRNDPKAVFRQLDVDKLLDGK